VHRDLSLRPILRTNRGRGKALYEIFIVLINIRVQKWRDYVGSLFRARAPFDVTPILSI